MKLNKNGWGFSEMLLILCLLFFFLIIAIIFIINVYDGKNKAVDTSYVEERVRGN